MFGWWHEARGLCLLSLLPAAGGAQCCLGHCCRPRQPHAPQACATPTAHLQRQGNVPDACSAFRKAPLDRLPRCFEVASGDLVQGAFFGILHALTMLKVFGWG